MILKNGKWLLLICMLLAFFAFGCSTINKKPQSKLDKREQQIVDMASQSDLVILGKVLKKKSRWVDKKIITTALVMPLEIMKGNTSKTIEVDYLGGHVGVIAQDISNEQTLDAGEVSLLFLRKADEKFKAYGTGMRIISEYGKIMILKPEDRSSRLKNNRRIKKYLSDVKSMIKQ